MNALRSLPPSSMVVRAHEGEYRDGPWHLPLTGGWLPHDVGKHWNWWQLGYDPMSGGTSAMVEACLSAYSQTVAMCPGDHWITNPDGGRERVTTSALSRILKRPNSYQSISDFLLNGVRNLYDDGNAYAAVLRNDRGEVAEMHLMHSRQSMPRIGENGEVFYQLSGNEIFERRFGASVIAPARDVLHIRLHTPRHPLRGETPLRAAALEVASSGAMNAQQLSFYLNQARPSHVLATDEKLSVDQIRQLRQLWDEQTKGTSAGGTPILAAGLKPLPTATNARDAQLAELMGLNNQAIALCFRIPLQILGLGASTIGSSEALMQQWRATGLGFCLNHIEEAFGHLFKLRGQPDEYVEFDTEALLRSAFKDRIEALARGVQGGIIAPNEARAKEGYGKKAHGDEPRVQQQVVPLSAAAGIPAAPPSPGPKPAAGPDNDNAEDEDDEKSARRIFRKLAYGDD